MLIQDIEINLEPIQAPPPISYWPPQPGWYVLGLIILLIIVLVIRYLYLFRKKNAYRKWSLEKLEDLRKLPVDMESFQKLNQLLKITALQAFSREKVASLSGRDWLKFLQNSCPDSSFTDSSMEVLIHSVYRNSKSISVTSKQWEQMIRSSKIWIEKHKADKKSD